MPRLHTDVTFLPAWRRQQAAQLDHLPDEGAPVSPGLLGLAKQNPAHDLRHRAENLRYTIRQPVVAQNIPFRKTAHNWRAESIDHSADPGLSDAVSAHCTWLDIAIKRVAAKLFSADGLLRMREGDDLGVTGDVAASDCAVDPFRYNLPVQCDHRTKGIFAFARCAPRQLDATRHHYFVGCAL